MFAPASDSAQSRLVELSYQAAVGLLSWDVVLDELKTLLDPCGVALISHDHVSNRSVGVLQRGFDPAAEANYHSHYCTIDPWVPPLSLLAAGTLYQSEDLVPRETLMRTEFYTKWLKPQGSFETGTGLVLFNEGKRQCTLSVRFGASDEHKVRPIASSLLMRLAPHMQRACQIGRLMNLNQARENVLTEVLDKLPYAALVVDQRARTYLSNRHADRIVRQLDGLVIGADSVVRATTVPAQVSLERLLHECILQRSSTHVFKIPKMRSAGNYYVGASRIEDSGQDYGNSGEFARLLAQDRNLILLFILDMGHSVQLSTEALFALFRLTPAEAGLAQALARGDTLAAYAQRREVSKQTLRNQLVGLLKKTSTSRQTDLVALLTRIGAIV